MTLADFIEAMQEDEMESNEMCDTILALAREVEAWRSFHSGHRAQQDSNCSVCKAMHATDSTLGLSEGPT